MCKTSVSLHFWVYLQLQSDKDPDNGSVKYILSGEGAGTIFVIDENKGFLHATMRLDRETKAFYKLKATVVNKQTGQQLEPETEFIVKLHDVNDNEPQFSQEVYAASVPERSDVGEQFPSSTLSVHRGQTIRRTVLWIVNVILPGTPVIQVTATDADDSMYGIGAKLVYSISRGQPYFSVDPNTGILSYSSIQQNNFVLQMLQK